MLLNVHALVEQGWTTYFHSFILSPVCSQLFLHKQAAVLEGELLIGIVRK